MLGYEIGCLPDLSLSKYQVFADSGIAGMLEAQTQFLRQLHRVALLGHVGIHLVFDYDPGRAAGARLRILMLFSGVSVGDAYADKLDRVVRASGLSSYYDFRRVGDAAVPTASFRYRSRLSKRERFLQTVVDSKESYFYIVPNWEMNDEARLYSLLKLMESFNERCVYRVDLMVEPELNERIHHSFERPLSFLRNIGHHEAGLSERSRQTQNLRDPNADEALRQYEDWLGRVEASSMFRARILSFADDGEYCQLMLDAVMTEALSQGTGDIVVEDGRFSAGDALDTPVEALCSSDAPRAMRAWSSTYLIEEAAAVTRLPVLFDGEAVELPKETDARQGSDGMLLGADANGHEVRVPFGLIPKHMFIAGVPGSGKTNTMLHLADALWNTEIVGDDGVPCRSHIPFLVLEPAKREYRELALFDIPELIVFSPSAVTDFPLRINPFEFPLGLTLSEHIGKLCEVFEGAFPIASPAPFILDRAIQTVYEHKGWSVRDVNTGAKPYPTMTELYEQFERELAQTNYDSEIRGNIQSVLEMRIGSLLRREKKDIFDAERSSLSPEEWLERPVIIELEALGEGPANFVTLLLCTLIRETLKVNPRKDPGKSVRHVIFLEEAHNLIAPEAQSQDGMDSNPKVAATAFIVKMLAEVRALREGIIIADQLPTAMAPEVIKNTNVKLVHRLTSADDRELVGGTMAASGFQMERMATYTSGEALCSYEKLLRPFEMRVSLVEQHGIDTPDDGQLYELMLAKPGFCALRSRDEAYAWNGIRQRAAALAQQEKKAIEGLGKLDLGHARFADMEQYVATCSRVQTGLERMRSRLIYESHVVERRYGRGEGHDDLIAAIAEIGSRHRACVEKLISCC